jgi:hypothetical protein
VAVPDIHGDYENFEKILKGTKLINDDRDWIGGKTHLVQLGDVLDRGDRAKEILDLLMKLEKQAEAAGGMVHVLIGNHEEANITGLVFDQARYMTYLQLLDFLPQEYIDKKEREIRKKHASKNGSDGVKFEARRKDFWDKEISTANNKIDHDTREAYTKGFNDKYGKWFLKKNIVIKINENIFVHGGIADRDDYLSKDLETINDEARRELRIIAEWAADTNRGILNLRPEDLLYVMQPDAPHWFRGWVREREDGNSATLTRVLTNFKASRMIIGHTVRDVESIETRKLDRFGERIWAIDVGISKFYNDQLFALIINKTEKGSEFDFYWGDDEKKYPDMSVFVRTGDSLRRVFLPFS